MSADTIINGLEKAWQVIKDGRPTVEIASSTANAVPDVDDWQSLAGARGPGIATMKWAKPVSWPMEDYVFVEFTILLKWDYGATYRGGGAYIPNLWIEVPHCYAGWTWDVDISMTVRNPTNSGTVTAPIARVPVTIAGTVSTYEQTHHIEWGLTVFGTGAAEVG